MLIEFLLLGFTGDLQLSPLQLTAWDCEIWPPLFGYGNIPHSIKIDVCFGLKLGRLIQYLDGGETDVFTINIMLNIIKQWKFPFKYSVQTGIQVYTPFDYQICTM